MHTTAETLLEIARIIHAPFEGHSRLRTQAAWVRTLCDEITRHKSAGPHVAALRAQLQEEIANLAFLLEEASMPEPPASGIRLRH